jgi:hypothetical protein
VRHLRMHGLLLELPVHLRLSASVPALRLPRAVVARDLPDGRCCPEAAADTLTHATL